jgi:hypothetical protein
MGTPSALNLLGGELPAGAARWVAEKLKTFGGVPVPRARRLVSAGPLKCEGGARCEGLTDRLLERALTR